MAAETGLHFYDAELTRLRARTHADPDARRADVTAAQALAAQQGATLFELRAALDACERREERALAALADVLSRTASNSTLPEVVRARALLRQEGGAGSSIST
jgi:hypothetical protein